MVLCVLVSVPKLWSKTSVAMLFRIFYNLCMEYLLVHVLRVVPAVMSYFSKFCINRNAGRLS